MRRKDLHDRTRDLGPNDLAALAAWVEAKRDALTRSCLIIPDEPGDNGVFKFRIPADIYSVADLTPHVGSNPLLGVTLQWQDVSAPATTSSPDMGVWEWIEGALYANTSDGRYQGGYVCCKESSKNLPTRVTYKCQPGSGADRGHLILVISFEDAKKAPKSVSVRFDRLNAPLLELPDP